MSMGIIFTFSLFCQVKQNSSSSNPCDGLKKMDTLIQNVLDKKYIYTWVADQDSSTGYVLSNDYIKVGNEYRSGFFDKITVIRKNETDSKFENYLGFSFFKINEDTTKVKLETYYVLFNRVSRTNKFDFSLDTVNCKWILNDSTMTWN